jgi:pimeloyl-ACP methyl ester carboxylesterase
LETILNLIYGLGILIAVVIFLGHFWQWFYHETTTQDETVYIRTDDGWRLALHRYRPSGPTVGLPVILCHGLCANRYLFDIKGAPSLADFLRRHGRDVWVAELRGSGMSDRPGIRHSDAPYSWGFGDHVRHDVPAIIDHVLSSARNSGVHWLGHSMGGMLILAHLASHPDSALASAIVVGSPTDFSEIHIGAFGPLLKLDPLLRWLPISPLPLLGRMIAPLAPWVPASVWGLFHIGNIEPSVARKTIALVSTPVSPSKLWLDFARFIKTGAFGPEDGPPYLEGLGESDVPILLMSGSKDFMAPPASVINARKKLKETTEAECVVMGKESGRLEDYGHVDLILGAHATEEVFPKILEWLQRHDSPDQAAPTV